MKNLGAILLLFVLITGLAYAAMPDSLKYFREFHSDEINMLTFRAFPDLLMTIPGLRIRQTGPPGQWTDFRIYNTDIVHSQLLFDGILLHDPWTGGADLNILSLIRFCW